MKPVIMILGAGVMQLPAFETARRNGWTTIAADGNPEAPCRTMADHFLPVDLKDRIGLAEKALEFKNKTGLSGVFTCGTDFSATVAWIARETGLPGIPYQTALNCTDKIRMRTVLKEHGVPCPKFAELSEGQDFGHEVRNLSFPLVVKPVDNMGGRGVITVHAPEDLPAAAAESIRFSRTGRAIAEEYMSGPEYSLDSLVYNGSLTVTGFADRHIYFPPCFIEMGHTLPTAVSEDQREEITRVFRKAVEALGITCGAAKGDIKLTPDGVKIGEIAARLSGGYMSGWTYPYASGVNLVEKGMMIAMGMDPGDLTENLHRTSSERAFISIPGRISRIEGLDEAHETDGIRDIFLRVEEGDSVEFPVNNVTKCGNVIACCSSREDALCCSETAVRKILIELDPEDERTAAFLQAPLNRDFPPSAYQLTESDWPDLKALDGFIPDFSRSYTQESLPVPGDDIMKRLDSRKDWHGRTLGETVTLLGDIRKTEFSHSAEWTSYARHFWHSLIRGGIQGALWFSDHNKNMH